MNNYWIFGKSNILPFTTQKMRGEATMVNGNGGSHAY